MPLPTSQVEVQVPPGLEALGFRMPTSLVQPSPGAMAAAAVPSREEIVAEVMQAVQHHVHTTTTAAVDALWQKGQKRMQYMQQQHDTQCELLQGQLSECARICMKLERENAQLRAGLEALMKHLTLVFGAPPHVPLAHVQPASPPAHLQPAARLQPHSPESHRSSPICPLGPQATTPPAGHSREAPITPAAVPLAPPRTVRPGSPQAAAKLVTIRTDVEEDFHTPAGTPRNAALLAASLAVTEPPPGLPHPAEAAETKRLPILQPVVNNPAACFTITLRRADSVPLGLDVRGDDDGRCLIVEAVRPGGAVEAWNRLCSNDLRDIKAGDRIMTINGAQDADSMRDECLTKHLLRMTVARGVGCPVAAAPRCTAALRAEADEFVPQVAARDALN